MNSYTQHFAAADSIGGQRRRGVSRDALRLWLVVSLAVADGVAVSLAFAAVRTASVGGVSALDYRLLGGTLLPICALSAVMTRAYLLGTALDYPGSLARALKALVVAAAIIVLILSVLGANGPIGRLPVLASFLLSAALMAALRKAHIAYAARLLGGCLETVVELREGSAPAGRGERPSHDTSTFFDPLRPNPFSLDQLARVIGSADRVIVHCAANTRSAWAKVMQGMNVGAEIAVREWGDVRPIGIGTYLGSPTMVVARSPLALRQRLTKRMFDIVFSALVLIGLAPLLALVALAIKLDSRGPVFFRQPRIGRRNKLFNVLKFRSMTIAACDPLGQASTCRDDPRTTRVGRFIRRTSIDELPQFINVLKGEMSVVGPRPHAISSTAEALLFWEADDRYWGRHAGRPGLTGRAQILGLRGATASVRDLTDRVDADLQYLRSWSLGNDLTIVVRTFGALLSSKAY